MERNVLLLFFLTWLPQVRDRLGRPATRLATIHTCLEECVVGHSG